MYKNLEAIFVVAIVILSTGLVGYGIGIRDLERKLQNAERNAWHQAMSGKPACENLVYSGQGITVRVCKEGVTY